MIDTLRDFVDAMNELGIDYMVTGSYAMSAYGEIRMTRDIDIVIELSTSGVRAFFERFKDSYYVSDSSIRRAVDRGSMFNVVSTKHGGKIDCIIKKDTEFGKASFSRRFKVSVAGIEFWNATREDLIISKLMWARDSRSEIQIRDISKLADSAYDTDYVWKWITTLGLVEIWAEVEKWKIRHKPRQE
jgi:hypothetical protein